MDSNSFLWGFVAGLGLALVFGWMWRLMNGWLNQRRAYKKPQVVVHTTSKTPEQVHQAARAATWRLLGLLALIALGMWLFVTWRFPAFAEQVQMAVSRFWQMIFG